MQYGKKKKKMKIGTPTWNPDHSFSYQPEDVALMRHYDRSEAFTFAR
jgi:hypothetical protein